MEPAVFIAPLLGKLFILLMLGFAELPVLRCGVFLATRALLPGHGLAALAQGLHLLAVFGQSLLALAVMLLLRLPQVGGLRLALLSLLLLELALFIAPLPAELFLLLIVLLALIFLLARSRHFLFP